MNTEELARIKLNHAGNGAPTEEELQAEIDRLSALSEDDRKAEKKRYIPHSIVDLQAQIDSLSTKSFRKVLLRKSYEEIRSGSAPVRLTWDIADDFRLTDLTLIEQGATAGAIKNTSENILKLGITTTVDFVGLGDQVETNLWFSLNSSGLVDSISRRGQVTNFTIGTGGLMVSTCATIIMAPNDYLAVFVSAGTARTWSIGSQATHLGNRVNYQTKLDIIELF